MATALTVRIGLLEVQLKELRRQVELKARYGAQPSSEALYRMWQAEREDNIRLRLLMQERERAHEAFRERTESGLRILIDRAQEISAKLELRREPAPKPLLVSPADEAERRLLSKFSAELERGTSGRPWP